jgi:uncharacterized membrane protein YGL010W
MDQSKIELLLAEYGESHQNKVNKRIHWICVPIIFFTIFGMIRTIPMFSFLTEISFFLNWATLILLVTLIYYFLLSKALFGWFLFWALFVAFGNELIAHYFGTKILFFGSLSGFVIAWIGQFIGHHIEGKKPSFLKDLQFLLIGPAWLLNFLVKAVPYQNKKQ